jgi:cholesterol transport system auxiliary component
MQYRLLYADARQSRPYAYNQWTNTPLQLLTQRIRTRIAQSGVKVLSATDAAASITLLRIEADDFVQNFDSATQSSGHISLRASVFHGHKLVDQKTFERTSAAPTPDAAGGARALSEAADAISGDILAWVASLPLQKE